MPCRQIPHTPIVSKQQQRLFGSELARREAGETPQMPGITKRELRRHLEESRGKNLPERITPRMRRLTPKTPRISPKPPRITPKMRRIS